MFMDTLANALNVLYVSEKKGMPLARVAPASSLVREVLLLMQKNKYVGEFEFEDDGKSGAFAVKLTGNINKCGVIKPRFAVGKDTWEKFEQRFLPAKDTGLMMVSTSEGVMSHIEAKEKKIGGRLLGYVY